MHFDSEGNPPSSQWHEYDLRVDIFLFAGNDGHDVTGSLHAIPCTWRHKRCHCGYITKTLHVAEVEIQ